MSDVSYEVWEGTVVSCVRKVINCGRDLLCRMQEKLLTVGGNCCVGCKRSYQLC